MGSSVAARAERRRKERRQGLLDAAEAILRERSLTDVTVQDITDAAGAAKGTFYLYFESKSDVIGALWERFVDGFFDYTGQLLQDGDDDWWQTAERLIGALVDYDLDHQELHRSIAASADANVLPLFWEADRRIIGLLSVGIADGVADGAFAVEDPLMAAQFLYHGTDGILLNAALQRRSLDRDAVVGQVTAFARRVLQVED